jgi:hypothetical protein
MCASLDRHAPENVDVNQDKEFKYTKMKKIENWIALLCHELHLPASCEAEAQSISSC